MLQTGTSTDDPLPTRREPDAHALLGMEVLGLDHLRPRARLRVKQALRYHWFAGRGRVLAAIGRVAEDLGPIAARLAADAVLARLVEGINLTTRDGCYIVKEAAHRLAAVQAVSKVGGRQ